MGGVSTGIVAKALGVSPETIRRWCERGRIRSYKTPGGHTRIPQNEFVRLLEKHSAKAALRREL
jgi:DNA binding domain, excisionase family